MSTRLSYQILILSLLSFVASTKTLAQLDIQLDLPKSDYLKAEPVFLDVTITNIGVGALRVSEHIEIMVSDETERIFPPWFQNVRSSLGPGTYLLSPNESRLAAYELVSSNGIGNSRLYQLRTKFFLPVGLYAIRVICTANSEKYESSECSFRVLEPQGSDLEAYTLIDQASDLRIAGGEEIVNRHLRTIATQYPLSPYRVLALLQGMEMYEWNESEDGQKIGLETALLLIEADPNSRAADHAITYSLVRCRKLIGTRKERIQFLEKIIYKYPNTIVGIRATKAYEDIFQALEKEQDN